MSCDLFLNVAAVISLSAMSRAHSAPESITACWKACDYSGSVARLLRGCITVGAGQPACTGGTARGIPPPANHWRLLSFADASLTGWKMSGIRSTGRRQL